MGPDGTPIAMDVKTIHEESGVALGTCRTTLNRYKGKAGGVHQPLTQVAEWTVVSAGTCQVSTCHCHQGDGSETEG